MAAKKPAGPERVSPPIEKQPGGQEERAALVARSYGSFYPDMETQFGALTAGFGSGGLRGMLQSEPVDPHYGGGITDTARNALVRTDIPLADLERAGTALGSSQWRMTHPLLGPMSALTSNEGGVFDPLSHKITYSRNLNAASLRHTLTHEIAHRLQQDEGIDRLVDIEKGLRHGNSDDSDEQKLARRLGWDLDRNELEAPSVHEVHAMPISEGSAEGYAHRYRGDTHGKPVTVGYKSAQFSPIGQHGESNFRLARSHTYVTGKPITNREVRTEVLPHVGVLQSDLVDGKRDLKTDVETASRMGLNYLTRTTPNPLTGEQFHPDMLMMAVPYEGERQERIQAVSPGSSATPLSPRGEAVRAGQSPDTMTYDETVFARMDQERAIRQQRRERGRPLPRTELAADDPRALPSGTRWRIMAHVNEKAKRDEEQAAEAERAERGAIHPDMEAHLGRFVNKQKGAYARRYAEWLAFGGDEPSYRQFNLKPETAEAAQRSVGNAHRKIHG